MTVFSRVNSFFFRFNSTSGIINTVIDSIIVYVVCTTTGIMRFVCVMHMIVCCALS